MAQPYSPANEAPTLVSLIQGRFYVPIEHTRRVGTPNSRGKRASPLFELARETRFIPAGINRSRPGIIYPEEEPSDEVISSHAQHERAQCNEVERTLSIFSLSMAQDLIPYSSKEREAMHASGHALSHDEELDRVRSFLMSKALGHREKKV